MAKSVVGLFDEKTNIDTVIRDLERVGVPRRHVHALARADAREREGSWSERVAAFFGFTGEAHERELGAAYADAMNEGDTLLIVDVEDEMADRTAAVLNQYGAINVGRRGQVTADPKVAVMSAQKPISQPAAPKAVPPLATQKPVTPLTAQKPASPPPAQKPIPPPPASGTIAVSAQTTIPVIQEELEIGKRIVERGGVRVHSHIKTMPIEEVIRLREEHIEVERRPVNRPLSATDAFEEVTIEMTETAEEVVVAKQARVVEEVVIGKKAEEHDEKIKETVRRQDVEVEQLPLTGTGGRR